MIYEINWDSYNWAFLSLLLLVVFHIRLGQNITRFFQLSYICSMSKSEKSIARPRFQAVPLLAQQFIRDCEEVINQYPLPIQIELTNHLLSVLGLMEQYIDSSDSAIWQQYRENEDALLEKYGKTLKPYSDKYFYKYFDFDHVLVEKGIYSTKEFNRLPPDEQGLTLNERQLFIRVCRNTLYNSRTFLRLRMDPENAEAPQDLSDSPEPDREATKARQLLAIYYLLKAGFNIEHRSSHSVSEVVRLAHLLTGTKLTNLQNSDIYKKYSFMPNYKKGEHLIADLKFIRPYFEELDIEKGIKLIDEEIERTIKELPLELRKKYKNKAG